MDYIEANLANDEKVVARIEHSWVAIISVLIGFLLLCGAGIVIMLIPNILVNNFGAESTPDVAKIPYYILGVLLILIGLIVLVAGIAEIANAQLVVTNKRLFGRRGFISKQTTDIMLNKIDTINAGNGFLGAIFHYGYIQLVSAASGTNKATLKYNYIANTMEFRKAVLQAIEKAKIEEREAQAKAMHDAMK